MGSLYKNIVISGSGVFLSPLSAGDQVLVLSQEKVFSETCTGG